MTDTRDLYKLVRELENQHQVNDTVGLHDSFDLELNEYFVIESGVVGLTEDGVIIQLDEEALEFLDFNGMLTESEEIEEMMVMGADSDASSAGSRVLGEGSSRGVADSIRHRILYSHQDVISKYGPVRIMAAIREKAERLDDLEEIGSSDISIWTKEVIDSLENGDYDNMDSIPVRRGVEEASPITSFSKNSDIFDKVLKSDDPFQVVYDGISGNFGEEARVKLQDIYDEVVIDTGYHPDDDFEKIIEVIVDQLVNDSADELSDIKRLAGQEEVAEGLGKALLGGAALIAAITGLSKLDAELMMRTAPQLVTLSQMRQEAVMRGDEREIKDLDERIRDTMDHISRTGSPVMDIDGKPVNPREPMGEAEYQGRKVPLGKPMQGDVAKSKVYVKKPDGKVVKVNFGDKNMTIKKNNPERRKSFRARHRCENPGPRWKARYWSCKAW